MNALANEKTVYNFCSGPAMLPAPVMAKAQTEFLDYQASGISVMEMSHRSSTIVEMFASAAQGLRDLLSISDDYEVLFLQGGASLQFSMIPMNLMRADGQADFLLTGAWSEKAYKEAALYGEARVIASDADNGYRSVPPVSQWQLNPKADYVHLTPNETIHGVEFTDWPDTGAVPVVADLSSSILSYPLDVSQYGLIYAGAQKNIGPAGLTIVIIRKDLIKVPERTVPKLLRYDLQAAQASMINTPSTFSVYLAGLVFDWLKGEGGVQVMAERNACKAQLLYDFLDASDFYDNPVAVENRSRMNVPFTMKDASLEQTFLREAKAQGLLNLEGHRSVGGMRASIYNAMPEAGVIALRDFMNAFAKRYG